MVRDRAKIAIVTNKKSHKPSQMTRKSSTLDDLQGLSRTLLCQSCGIVAKRYVVGGRRLYSWIEVFEVPKGCQFYISLSAAVWPQLWMQSFCLQPSSMCAKLSYLILALIVAFDIGLAASPQRECDCSHSRKSLSFRDRKSNVGLRI